MAVTTPYTGYAVKAGTTVIGGVQDVNMAPGHDVINEALSGDPYSRFQAIRKLRPKGDFSTKALATVIGLFDSGAHWASIDDMTGGVILYKQQKAAGGMRASGSVHQTQTINAGLFVPRSISIPNDGDATMTVDLYVIYDGSNAPVIMANTAALPGGVTDTLRYGLGAISVGGVTIDHVTQVDIEFGLEPDILDTDGDLYPTFAGIKQYMPTVSITTLDPGLVDDANIPIIGKAGTHANTSIVLRKRGATSYAGANDITITAAGIITPQTVGNVSGNENATTQIQLAGVFDGTNLPLTFSVAA